MKKLFVHPQCPFSVDTFNLVSAQFQDEFNCHDFYLLHHNDFLTYVENPLKYIFKQVEKLLPASIQKFIPINSESFGYIKKEGLESIDCSIALGFKDICSVDDPQFMLSFEKQKLTFGFYAKSDSAAWIIQNYQDCLQYSKDAEKLLKAYKLPNYYQCYLTQKIIRNNSQKPKTIEETIQPQKNIYTLLKAIYLSELIDEHFYPDKITNIRVILSLDFPKLLGLSAKKIILLIAQTFKQMFPLFLCSKRYPEYSPVIVISRYISVYETEFNQFYDIAEISEITGFQTSELDRWIRTINRKQQAIIQGPPGTGKTFLAQKLAQYLIGGGDGFSDIIQFHPAYTYEDFIQGIRPQSQNGQLTYPIVPGRFLEFCTKAESCQDTCVLIIDEINRANLSQVFGELMYLLDDRDRTLKLASGQHFSIPKNVFIIGTMNTADRSIALVDNALRRRFAFIPIYPNYEVLRHYHQRENTGFPVDKLITLLQEVNEAINNKHYQLGISFFLTKTLTEDIQDIWQMEIEPYLEEYFFDNSEKLDEFIWDKIQDKLRD